MQKKKFKFKKFFFFLSKKKKSFVVITAEIQKTILAYNGCRPLNIVLANGRPRVRTVGEPLIWRIFHDQLAE